MNYWVIIQHSADELQIMNYGVIIQHSADQQASKEGTTTYVERKQLRHTPNIYIRTAFRISQYTTTTNTLRNHKVKGLLPTYIYSLM